MTTQTQLIIAVAVVATCLAIPSARSLAGPDLPATPPKLSDFQLVASKYNSSADTPAPDSFFDRIAKLDKQLPKLGVQRILGEANRPATTGDKCTSNAFKDMEVPKRRFCFHPTDTGSEDAENIEWMPQGVTTVADAQEDQQWGDKQAILVSWYDKKEGAAKGVRVSFLDIDTLQYQHVLLVYPYITKNGDPSYEILSSPQAGDHAGIHAGGIAWYGNFLYVVDTNRGIRAFDMRRIFDLKEAGDRADLSEKDKVGLHGGTYYAFGYRYVMPQVAAWENPGGLASFPADHACSGDGTPKYSFIALDRSGADALITGEYCSEGAAPDNNGRVARWPLDSATGLPKLNGGTWRAEQAYRLPTPHVQGALSYEGTWYLNRTGGGKTKNATLIEATPSAATTGLLTIQKQRKAAIGTEDLSYWPGRNELWTVTEHPGKRVLYATPR